MGRGNPYQAVLLIAFGGPTCPQEIRPFLARVTEGIPIPQARLEEVAHHYEAVGGKSPLNEITFRQAAALKQLLNDGENRLPVYVGMRNSKPFFAETLRQMANDGIKCALGFILSSQRSEAGWGRYQKNLAEACTELGDSAPAIAYCDGWHDHPLFIQCWADLISAAFALIASGQRDSTPLIFTAHSLPTAMAQRSPYVAEVQRTARLIAQSLGHGRWSLAYQSRSGRPSDPWLEPDIGQMIRDLAAQGVNRAVVAPIGFVCDHVEVLYDLDIEATKLAEGLGVKLLRASCPNDHPTFIRMMADVIDKAIAARRS
jgi:ferrochelatase